MADVGRIGIAFVSAVLALAGWRNLPQLDHTSSAAAGVLLGLVVWLAYWSGLRARRDAAVAVAVARAEAKAAAAAQSRASANVLVNLDPALGARLAGEAAGMPSQLPWVGRAELDAQEGLQDVLEQSICDGQDA